MFGMNRAEIIGRLGADATINNLPNGGRVANISLATDESYVDKSTGKRVERTEWHRVVTFQPGLVDMLANHGHKGRLVTSPANSRPASGTRTATPGTPPKSCWFPVGGCSSSTAPARTRPRSLSLHTMSRRAPGAAAHLPHTIRGTIHDTITLSRRR